MKIKISLFNVRTEGKWGFVDAFNPKSLINISQPAIGLVTNFP